ncbi:hypothetical protein AC230_16560 [Streptomyces caatingaensis]|uniref:Uncharacterized protein n=1 Tax=Streptomyces caatingaensis TaxID=1678637 RepID=A0A0K9XGV6_9ACTN|nr:hypothetical protein AC230_16560 [Streptomyces caatingaensis]
MALSPRSTRTCGTGLAFPNVRPLIVVVVLILCFRDGARPITELLGALATLVALLAAQTPRLSRTAGAAQ